MFYDNEGLISVTTDKRWKGLEEKLRDIAGSFKVRKTPATSL